MATLGSHNSGTTHEQQDDGHGNAATSSGTPPHGRLCWHDSPDPIDPAAWNALLAASPAPTPFLRHEYLAALQHSGSAVPATGWTPRFLTLQDADGTLQAGAALYLKSHSYGEYVFDWAWADAWERAGQRYYPKLLGAVPFTPVPGSRLLARSAPARAQLLQAIEQHARAQRLSSAHLLFLDEADRAAAEAQGWLLRQGVQFHWHNRDLDDAGAPSGQPPYQDFTDFLAHLTRDKRKKMQQERRYVREAGIEFQIRQGRDIRPADWDYFHTCYTRTYRAHHSTPYLNRAFWQQMADSLPEHWLMLTAVRGTQPVATSLLALDPERRVAWGRYWGSTEDVPHLHFSACYHEPLAWCVEQRYRRFEGGAQGEHKMARGLLPVRTWSAHWLSHPGFADAVADFLQRESAHLSEYEGALAERRPFRP